MRLRLRQPPRAVLWPDIDGIDAVVARDRWCDDVELFRAMLERFLQEFADIESAAPQAAAAFTVHAARLHKLRGGACMLGAKAVQQLAAEAEAACAAGDGVLAGQATRRIAAELTRVRSSVAAAFDAAPAHAGAREAQEVPALVPQQLADLVSLLRQNRASALNDFKSITPQLKRLLGAASFAALRTQVDDLEFAAVADALEALVL